MSPEIIEFNSKYHSDIEFRIKVIVGQIIIGKIFLDSYFEKYYNNFIAHWIFDSQKFLKCVWKIDLMLDGENYKIRYENFENDIMIIMSIIQGNKDILDDLKESIIWDLHFILWNDFVSDLEIIRQPQMIQKVKEWILCFLDLQYKKLQSSIIQSHISKTKTDFIRKIERALKQKKWN